MSQRKKLQERRRALPSAHQVVRHPEFRTKDFLAIPRELRNEAAYLPNLVTRSEIPILQRQPHLQNNGEIREGYRNLHSLSKIGGAVRQDVEEVFWNGNTFLLALRRGDELAWVMERVRSEELERMHRIKIVLSVDTLGGGLRSVVEMEVFVHSDGPWGVVSLGSKPADVAQEGFVQLEADLEAWVEGVVVGKTEGQGLTVRELAVVVGMLLRV